MPDILELLSSTCHGISPGITAVPPTMRLIGMGGSSSGASASRRTHQGNFIREWICTELFVEGEVPGVLAGVEGGDAVVEMTVGAVVFCRLAFPWRNRERESTALTSVRAVLPHGNSTRDVRKEESHR